MWWYGNGMSGWGYALMLISNVLFWALIVAGVIALVRFPSRSERTSTSAEPRPAPEQLLAERFARGEIDQQEYRTRLDTLRNEFRARVEP